MGLVFITYTIHNDIDLPTKHITILAGWKNVGTEHCNFWDNMI